MSKDLIKRTKSLIANFKKATNIYHPHLDYIIDEHDVAHWWCRIRDLDGCADEFKSGEYLIEMFAPNNYPFGPPKFLVRTPNGVYAPDINVCVSIGHFHKDDFAAGQGGMMGFMCQLLSGLMFWKELGTGLGLLHPEYAVATETQKRALSHTLEMEKRILAKKSRDYNLKNYPEIMQQFDKLPLFVAVRQIPKLGLSHSMMKRVRLALSGE